MLMERLYSLRCKIVKHYSTWKMRIKMVLWGVKYGKNVNCTGPIIFYRAAGSSIIIGNNCSFNSDNHSNFRGINHRCIIHTGMKEAVIKIGNNCGFSGVSIVASVGVTIGEHVLCGTNVMIGDRNDHENLYKDYPPAPVVIGNNVWIGMNSVIMRGVHIGDNVIIGANSVVTKDIPANTVAAGIPCKVIKER